MGNSLQDQLLKSGLVSNQDVKVAKKQKSKKKKQARKTNTEIVDETKQAVDAQMQAKKAKDQALNEQINQAAQEKAILAQIKQLVGLNEVAKNQGEIAYNFTDNNKVKHIYVDQKQQTALSKGQLSIVKLDEQYRLVPMAVADKIAERNESVVLLKSDEQATETEEDNYYADYQIPDDLMW